MAASEKATKPRKPTKPRQPTQKATPKKKGGLKVKLVRSVIGCNRHQREVVRGLGLKRLRQTVERQDTPEIRGMVARVSHLVEIIEG